MAQRMGQSPPARPKSWVKYPQVPCHINRRTYPHVSFARWDLAQVAWTHNGCLCNEIVALKFRHQVATPPVVSTIDDQFFNKLLKDNPVELYPMKRWGVISTYQGAWKQKYIAAKEKLDLFGWLDQYSVLNIFSKDDLELSSPQKAPRAIQYRDPCFLLEHARYIKPIEKWFYSLRDEYNTRIVGKADGYTIANDLIQKADSFVDPVFLLLDASKFDSCVDVKWLQYTHRCYQRLFVCGNKMLRKLSSLTLTNVGRSRRGISYKTRGTRMSGDMDTGLGNSLIMWTLLKGFLHSLDIKGSIYVNGDDSVVVIERKHLGLTANMDYFKNLGFNMKYEVADTLDQLEFCQARLMETDYGFTMARNPERVIGKTGWCVRDYGKRRARDHVHTLGLCERAASWGVPIASAMATAFLKATPTGKYVALSPWLNDHYNSMRKWWKTGEPKISLQTRVNFENVWGISVSEQFAIERSMRVRLLREPTAIQRHQLDLLLE